MARTTEAMLASVRENRTHGFMRGGWQSHLPTLPEA